MFSLYLLSMTNCSRTSRTKPRSPVALISTCIRRQSARSSIHLWPSGVEPGTDEHECEHDQKPEQPGHTCGTHEGATQVTQGEQTMQQSQGLELGVACPREQTED